MKASSNDEISILLRVLDDKNASISDRDDAAINLGGCDNDRAVEALMKVATDVSENEVVLASAGESLAQIWLRCRSIDIEVVRMLHPIARREAVALLEEEFPELHHDMGTDKQ